MFLNVGYHIVICCCTELTAEFSLSCAPLLVKFEIFDVTSFRDAGTIKRQGGGGKRTPKGTSI
jgi:hypothetical protein